MTTPMRPPRPPKGEPLKVTIANQDNQIRMLTQRVVELTKWADDHEATANKWYHEARQKTARIQHLEMQLEDARVNLAQANKELDYQRGYIARVKEGDRNVFAEVPELSLNSSAPGF